VEVVVEVNIAAVSGLAWHGMSWHGLRTGIGLTDW
jgi:hypothetical protein